MSMITPLLLGALLLAPRSDSSPQPGQEESAACSMSDPPPPCSHGPAELDRLEAEVDALLAADQPWPALVLARTILRRRTELLGASSEPTLRSIEQVAAILEHPDMAMQRRGAMNLWLEVYRRRAESPPAEHSLRRAARTRATALAIEFEDYDTAIDLLLETLEDPWTSELAASQARLQLAISLCGAGRHAEAISIAAHLADDSIERRGPDDLSLSAMLVAAYGLMREGRLAAAELEFARASFLHPPILRSATGSRLMRALEAAWPRTVED